MDEKPFIEVRTAEDRKRLERSRNRAQRQALSQKKRQPRRTAQQRKRRNERPKKASDYKKFWIELHGDTAALLAAAGNGFSINEEDIAEKIGVSVRYVQKFKSDYGSFIDFARDFVLGRAAELYKENPRISEAALARAVQSDFPVSVRGADRKRHPLVTVEQVRQYLRRDDSWRGNITR